MELKPNMYVRIKWGNGLQTISKCTNKVDMGDTQYSNNDFYIHTDIKGEVIYKSMIVKASYNIIDLIKVGDYVNGLLVTRICFDEEANKKYLNLYGSVSEWEEEDIKTILTKEVFKANEYRVETD